MSLSGDKLLELLEEKGVKVQEPTRKSSTSNNTSKSTSTKNTSTKITKTNSLTDSLSKKAAGASDDDIAPVFTSSNDNPTWFQKGAFSDGYQFGDVFRTILGTDNDILDNIGLGARKMAENIIDFGATGVGFVAEKLGAEELADNLKTFVAQDTAKDNSALFAPLSKTLLNTPAVQPLNWAVKGISALNNFASGDADNSVLGDRADSFVQGATQFAIQRAAPVPWQLLSGVTSFGGEAESAFREDATYNEAAASGLISAGGEILSEYLMGGMFGETGLDDALVKKFTREISDTTLRGILTYAVKVGGESFVEEPFSWAIGKIGQRLTYADDKTLKELMTSDEAKQELVDTVISSLLLSGFAQGADAVRLKQSGVDYTSGLSSVEEQVVRKLYDDEIAKKKNDSKKTTTKAKNNVWDKIVGDMEKGRISTDTILEILDEKGFSAFKGEKDAFFAGEDYKAYQDSIKSEQDQITKLEEELKKLADAPNTVGNSKQYDTIQQQIEQLKNSTTKADFEAKMKPEIDRIKQMHLDLLSKAAATVKDSKLAESFNELARSNQKFKADVSKYDAKQRATIQKAIDSGILNNTNKTHEFVDMIAKITADKGVSFDFTNNQKLKESGFAVEGATVNGYVTKDGVTLNVNSAKALNSVVGHEITHVLEGTELYDILSKTITEYAKSKGEYNTRLAHLTELYKNVKDADVNKELVADLVGDYLFTDAKFVQKLTENRNVFQKIFDEIKYLCKVATAGSEEARQLERAKALFVDAFRATKNTAKEGGIQYSVSYEDAIDRLSTGTLNRTENTHLLVAEHTPQIYIDKAGAKDLKIITGWDTAYLAMNKSGDLPGNYHGLGTDIMKAIPKALEDPLYIVKQDNGRIIAVTEVVVKGNRAALVSIELDAYKATTQDGENKADNYNLIVTFFDAKSNYLKNTVFKGDVVYNKNNEDPAHFILRLKSLKKAVSDDAHAGSSNENSKPQNGKTVKGDYSLSANEGNVNSEYAISDSESKVKTLYTGSSNTNIQQFVAGGTDATRRNGDRYGVGVYLTTNKNVAKGYAGENGRVYKINADGLNVFDLNNRITSEMRDSLVSELASADKSYRNSLLRNFRTEKSFSDFDSALMFFDEQSTIWNEQDGRFSANKPVIKSADSKSGKAVIEFTDFNNWETSIGNLTGNQLYDSLKSISSDDFSSFVVGNGFDGISFDEDAYNKQYVIYKNEDKLQIESNDEPKHSLSNSPKDFNFSDLTIDEVLGWSDAEFEQAYRNLGLETYLELDDDVLLDDNFSVESIGEELDVEPETIQILFRRNGLGNSHVEDNRSAVMTQDRINQRIHEHGAGQSDYARRYITRISPKDFIDLTVYAENMNREAFDSRVRGDHDGRMGEWDYNQQLRDSSEPPVLIINKSTGQVIGHNGRHRVRALELSGIESVEIEVELHDEDGYLIKYDAQTIPDMAISSQYDTAIETHISNIVPLNNVHRDEIGAYYGENAHSNAGVKYSLSQESEDVAPVGNYNVYGSDVALSQEDIAPIDWDTVANNAEVAPDYAPVAGTQKPGKAKVLPNAAKVLNKKAGIGSKVKDALIDRGTIIETMSIQSGNRELQATYKSVGRSQVAAQYFMKNGNTNAEGLDELRKTVEKSGKTQKFYDYLYNLHNIDRMNANKPLFGTRVTAEMSRAKADKLLKENPEFKQWADVVHSYNSELLEMQVECGIITPQLRDKLHEMYPNYVPIMRVGDDLQNFMPPENVDMVVNPTVKRATGGDRPFLPLFETMAIRTEQTFKAVAMNKFGTELKNTLGFGAIEGRDVSFDEALDIVAGEQLHAASGGMNPTFTIYENGQRVTFPISEEIYQTMQPKSDLMKTDIKPLSGASNLKRSLITEYNPAFTMRNLIKDTQDVLFNSQHAARTYANYPKAIAALLDKNNQYYREYMENGGESVSYFKEDNTFTKEKGAIRKVIGFPLDAISYANNFIERVPRMAEYIASREMGRSIDVSMLDAARVTTDFSAGGDLVKLVNRNGFTFLNSSVQGTLQNVRNIREAKAEGLKGWAKLATKVMIAGLPEMLLNNLLWEDDEDYEDLADYIKDKYYVVAKYGDGQFVRIPKGRVAAVISNAFTQIQNKITGNDELDFDTFSELVVDNLLPNEPLDNNIFAPFVQAYQERAWHGGDFFRSGVEDLPTLEQYDEKTDSLSRWLSEKANELLDVEISPYKINYVLENTTGILGDYFLPMMTPAAEQGDDSFLGNLLAPIRDDFTADSVLSNQKVTDFYSMKENLAAEAEASGSTEDLMSSRYANSIGSEMYALYEKKREIQNSNLSDPEKFAQVRNIQKQINALAKKGLANSSDVYVNGKYAEVADKRYDYSDYKGAWYEIKEGSEYHEREQNAVERYGVTAEEYWQDPDLYYTANWYFDSEYIDEDMDLEAVASTVFGMKEFAPYASDIAQLKGDDLDGDGKSDSGTKKKKVFAYVDALDIPDVEKAIIKKMSYRYEKSHNYDIINYLNGREDLTYNDRVKALRGLGFTVSDDGYISWK